MTFKRRLMRFGSLGLMFGSVAQLPFLIMGGLKLVTGIQLGCLLAGAILFGLSFRGTSTKQVKEGDHAQNQS